MFSYFENLFRCFLSQLQYRNENQNFNSNFIFQFIKKNEMALSVHGLISICGAATKMKFSCKSFFSKSEQIIIISFKITPFFVQCDDKSEPISKTRTSSENKIFQRQKKIHII